jgi:glycosyltransferase involved in cell wall biosynthesis
MITYPTIAAVPPGLDRPQWSVMIPIYNSTQFLAETLESVLLQDPGAEQMQIEVIDNCSTIDDPEPLVKAIGRGRISFYRQPRNVGMVGNFNTCIQRSRGLLVQILHADDYLRPEFYEHLGKLTASYPDVDLFACRAHEVDEEGRILGLTQSLEDYQTPVHGIPNSHLPYFNPLRMPFVIVRRSFYEQYGGYCDRMTHTTDWEMWVRGLNYAALVALNEPLAFYRYCAATESNVFAKKAKNLHERIILRDILAAQYPDFDLAEFNQELSNYSYWQATHFMELNDRQAAKHSTLVWWNLHSRLEKLKQWLAMLVKVDRERLGLMLNLL